jgi:hypothetical protein
MSLPSDKYFPMASLLTGVTAIFILILSSFDSYNLFPISCAFYAAFVLLRKWYLVLISLIASILLALISFIFVGVGITHLLLFGTIYYQFRLFTALRAESRSGTDNTSPADS